MFDRLILALGRFCSKYHRFFDFYEHVTDILGILLSLLGLLVFCFDFTGSTPFSLYGLISFLSGAVFGLYLLMPMIDYFSSKVKKRLESRFPSEFLEICSRFHSNTKSSLEVK